MHFLLGVVGIYLLFINGCTCTEEPCDRRPLGTKTAPLPPDNRFSIDIMNIYNDKYIPNQQYTVALYSRDNQSTFIAFTLSAQGYLRDSEKNPRKKEQLQAGSLSPSPNFPNAQLSHNCENTLTQSDITPKVYVEAIWTAPGKNNKCVTIYAVLAVKPDVWYSFEGPLSKVVCEDTRKIEDMQPMENENCQVCEDARYQLTFEGTWSYNTHPTMFPTIRELAKFSDIVGASHSKNFNMFKYNSEATRGLKMLAEQGNTTQLELEIQEKLGSAVRTIIKATGPPQPNMTTVTSFRATRDYHLVSLAAALLPSPDWFIGVSNFELCNVKSGQWEQSIVFNLYPMDAGTDSGLTFESANEETSPHQPISSAVIDKKKTKEEIKPFAKLYFDLVRTYSTSSCTTEAPVTEKKDTNRINEVDVSQGRPEPSPPTTTTSEEPPAPDPESSSECPMTAWDEWLPCDGECTDGKLMGFQIRFRYHLVDGLPVKYTKNGLANDKEVPKYCLELYPDSETRECEDTCEAEEPEDEEPEEEEKRTK